MFDIAAQLSLFLGILAFLIYFLGEYLAWVFRDQINSKGSLPDWLGWIENLDRIFEPIENFIYRSYRRRY